MPLNQLLEEFHRQMVEDYATTLRARLEDRIGVRIPRGAAKVSAGSGGRAKVEAVIAEIAKERGLRERDLELLRDAIAGVPRATILRRRGISPNTFKTHVRLLVTKLEVPSMQDAALVVMRRALDR